MKLAGYIYCITNLINGKKYVGYTRISLEYRWREHQRQAKKGSPCVIHAALRKYGVSNFKISCLATIEGTHSVLILAEKFYIKKLSSMVPKGYNLTPGGEGIDLMVPEVKARMLQGIIKRSKNPLWIKNVAEGALKRSADPKWYKNTVEAARRRSADPEWQKSNAKALRKLSKDLEWRIKHNIMVREKAKDPEWLEKSVKSLAKAHAATAAKVMAQDALRTPEDLVRILRKRANVKRYRDKKKRELIGANIHDTV